MARSCQLVWNDPNKQMKISHIDLQQCPIVIIMVYIVQAEREEQEKIKENSPMQEQCMPIDVAIIVSDLT